MGGKHKSHKDEAHEKICVHLIHAHFFRRAIEITNHVQPIEILKEVLQDDEIIFFVYSKYKIGLYELGKRYIMQINNSTTFQQ